MNQYGMDTADTKEESTSADDRRGVVNPYRPYDLESGSGFYHDEVIKQIGNVLEDKKGDRVFILIGHSGTGKTSTLKRLECSPELLGGNYIPIYLDAKDLRDMEYSDFLYTIFRQIVEKLNRLDYKLAVPTLFDGKHAREETELLSTYLLSLQAALEPAVTLLLIFDDFDILLEHMKGETITTLLKSFINIKALNWSNYALILAGNKKFKNIVDSQEFDNIIDSIPKEHIIQIADDMPHASIRKLIVEPVKGRITYEDDAVERIIRLSGKNFYFQQLICFYLLNYLNENQKNTCHASEVDPVIDLILKDERPEFTHAWEKILAGQSRVILSALVDDSVIEKRSENFYFLKENNLLQHMYPDLPEKMKRMEDYGYVNPLDGRKFSAHPFKIPLYGEWVKRKHPFIKTVIEQIDYIAERVEIGHLLKAFEETPEEMLRQFSRDTVVKIFSRWCWLRKVLQTNNYLSETDFHNFFEILCNRLGIKIEEKPNNGDRFYILDIKRLGIGNIKRAFCFFQERFDLTEDDVFNIETQASIFAQQEARANTQLTIYFCSHQSAGIDEIAKKSHLNFLLIGEDDLKKIVLSERSNDAFRNIIFKKLSIVNLSPYVTEGPVKNTFIGRNHTLGRVLNERSKSFSVVGARKIGKSSLLYRLKELFPEDTICIFLDIELEFAKLNNYRTFIKSAQREVQATIKKKIDIGMFALGKDVSKFARVVNELKKEGKKVVFIFDEIDGLLDFDQKRNFQLSHTFRTLSQKNECQFIFAGFKGLYHQKRNINHPLYNFCEEILLKPLSREAALELISKPMRSIGVHFHNRQDRELILNHTSRHPNFIQYFCQKLIERIDGHDSEASRRIIYRQDIEKVQDSSYENYVLDDVYMFKTDLTPITRLILMLLVENIFRPPRLKTFSEGDINEFLEKEGVSIPSEELHKRLRNLVMRFILMDVEENRYAFALPNFPDILKKRINDSYKKQMVKEIMKNGA